VGGIQGISLRRDVKRDRHQILSARGGSASGMISEDLWGI